MSIKMYPGLVLAGVALFTGCTALPDVTTFATATQRMNSATDAGFVAAGEVFESGMLATLDLAERRDATCGTEGLNNRDLTAACEAPTEDSFPDCPKLGPDQKSVRTSLLCMELAHRRLRLFQVAAAGYSGSLEKVIAAGKNGKNAAKSLVGSVNGIGSMLTGSGLIEAGAAKVFEAFYGEVAKRRARSKLRNALPATDLAVEDLHRLLRMALAELGTSFEAGSDAVRARLLKDRPGALIMLRAGNVTSRRQAQDFLFQSKLEPDDPEGLGAFVEELETGDEALQSLKASVVFFCNEGVTSLEEVVCGAHTAAAYEGTECAGEEEQSACCLATESCCAEPDCKPFSDILTARVTRWKAQLKKLDAIDKEFPKERLEHYLEAENSYRAIDRDTRALLAAARLSVDSWRQAHGAIAEAVKPGD